MTPRRSVQKRFAEFYKLYAGDFQDDVPIYLDIAAKHPGPVLEVGCGTGRVTAHLASAGHEVHAVDVVRDALEVAAQHVKPWDDRVRVQDFDLRAQPLPERFHVALVPLYHFNSLIDIEEQRLFLRNLRASVKGPGIIAVDFFCPLQRIRPEECDEWREISRLVGGHRLYLRDKREMLTPLLERRTQIFRIDGEAESEVVVHRRYLPPIQAARLIEEAGFESPRCVADYDLSTIGPGSIEVAPAAPFIILANA